MVLIINLNLNNAGVILDMPQVPFSEKLLDIEQLYVMHGHRLQQNKDHLNQVNEAPSTGKIVIRVSKNTCDKSEKAAERGLSTEVIAVMARSTDWSIREQAAKQPFTNAAILSALSHDVATSVRQMVAAHPNTPVSDLERLSTDHWVEVRKALVGNIALPQDILETLLMDPYTGIRHMIAETRKLPLSTIHWLVDHDNTGVAAIIAINYHDPAVIFDQLIALNDKDVNVSIVKNIHTPPHLLEHLLYPVNESVHLELVKRADTPLPLIEQLTIHATNQAAKPPMEIKKQICLAIAQRKDVTMEILHLLSTVESYDLLEHIARHPLASKETLKNLYKHPLDDIKALVTLRFIPAFLQNDMINISSVSLLGEQGYEYSALFNAKKLKDVSRALIGTAHVEEIRMLFSDDHMRGIRTINLLQIAFTDTRRYKLDRHRYLQFLKVFNDFKIGTWIGEVAPEIFNFANKIIGLNGLITLEIHSRHPADTIRMLYYTAHSDIPDEQERTITQIYRWLNKNKSMGDAFHNYLMKKEKRETRETKINTPFYQSSFEQKVRDINIELSDESFVMTLPINHKELKRIGHEQKHCVGGQHYANECISGSSIIFALSPLKEGKADLRHGYTFQFKRNGSLNQAQGFANSIVDKGMVEKARELYDSVFLSRGSVLTNST
jgi:hypothetical protein